jgi:hypothetical protein
VQVRFDICPLFMETFGNHREVLKKLDEFIAAKTRDPLAAFGNSDKVFTRGTPIAEVMPKLRKAHLNHDVSILYMISGRDPTVIRLYAVLSHDESGTGQPSNMRVQRNMAKRLAQQTFEPFKK